MRSRPRRLHLKNKRDLILIDGGYNLEIQISAGFASNTSIVLRSGHVHVNGYLIFQDLGMPRKEWPLHRVASSDTKRLFSWWESKHLSIDKYQRHILPTNLSFVKHNAFTYIIRASFLNLFQTTEERLETEGLYPAVGMGERRQIIIFPRFSRGYKRLVDEKRNVQKLLSSINVKIFVSLLLIRNVFSQ